jgi:hypothetical protein
MSMCEIAGCSGEGDYWHGDFGKCDICTRTVCRKHAVPGTFRGDYPPGTPVKKRPSTPLTWTCRCVECSGS